MSSNGLIQREREERIAELEERLARKSYVGVSVPVSCVALAAVCFLLGLQWRDLRYFFSSRSPVGLGTEGAYQLEKLESNVFAQVHGLPTARGLYGLESGRRYVLVGLRGTPIIVRRRPLPGEEQLPGRAPPAPDQRPFGVKGRLLAQRDATRYAETIQKFTEMGEVRPLLGRFWILQEGERPGSDLKGVFLVLILLTFGGMNGWFLWRNLRHRFRFHSPSGGAADRGA